MDPRTHTPQPPNPELAQEILRRLQSLPPQYFTEVARFIDYLRYRHEESEESLAENFMHLSNASFKEVWENDEDAVYDKL